MNLKKGIFFMSLWAILITNNSFAVASTPVDDYNAGCLASDSGNYSTAKKKFELGANRGEPDAQWNLATLYFKGQGVQKNSHEAFKWMQFSAKQGYVRAQSGLGMMYMDGEGVRQNYHEAVKWYRLAANKNYTIAQGLLGIMYLNGKGVKQDRLKAKEWFGKACDNGCQIGCDEYRKMNEQGY